MSRNLNAWDLFWTNSRKVASGKRIAGDIRAMVNARSLQFECARVLHESLVVPVLMYGSQTMIWREKERSRISAAMMDNDAAMMENE